MSDSAQDRVVLSAPTPPLPGVGLIFTKKLLGRKRQTLLHLAVQDKPLDQGPAFNELREFPFTVVGNFAPPQKRIC